MKRWLIAILVIAVAFIISLYLFIPNIITIQKSITVNVSQQAIHRILIESQNWNKGWPGNDSALIKDTGQSVSFNGNSYSVIDKKYSSILLAIHRGNDTIALSSLNIIGISKGTVKLDWEASMPVSNSPFRRLKMYRESKEIENDLEAMLNKMDYFYSKTENIYGISIQRERIIDTTLLFNYDSCKGYPDVEFIYSLITELNNYINGQHAKITGYPMLNIYTKDSISYLVKVALPIDKKLPPKGKITYKWMLPNGIMLVTKVQGDQKAIDSSFQQVENYMKDYGVMAAAIPFVSMVTNRLQEKNGTNWITRICYPIMEL